MSEIVRVTKREVAEPRLHAARSRYRAALRKLKAMGEGDGWPNFRSKAETGIVRNLLKGSGSYSDILDIVPEFVIFMAMCGDYTPRKGVEEELRLHMEAINKHFWVECRPLPSWADDPW